MSRAVDRIVEDACETIWNRRGLQGWAAWLALQPASALFGVGVGMRNLSYRLGILRTHRAGIPVVSVGNLSVGGTGKTPLTLWLADRLMATGITVGIVLRGYAGSARGVTVVSQGAGPEVSVDAVGDEPVMLAKCFRGPIVTARHRIDAARRAQELGCRLIVLDDGFQHRALARDFDLVLVDDRAHTLLPAGPMREGRGALKRAHAIAWVRRFADEHAPAMQGQGAHMTQPMFAVRFAACALVESQAGVWHELPIQRLSGRRVATVAGIANPGRFYATVREWEAQIHEVFEFPDHYRYRPADWQHISRQTHDVDLIVTTEKDLVKLETFPFARGKLVALRIRPEIDGADALVRLIMERTGLVPGHTQ
jgi:tetraacyldisaccharide 4'-kinase